jgi:hypothetical protein
MLEMTRKAKKQDTEWIWLPHEQYVFFVADLAKKKKMMKR